MADRVHTPIPAAHCNRRPGTDHPPLRDVPSMAEWCAAHHAPRRQGWLARILSPRAASPVPLAGACPSTSSAVEAGAETGGEGK